MTKYTKITLISFVLAAACQIAHIAVEPVNLKVLFMLAAVVFTIVFVCFLAVSISQRLHKNISPYRVFAVTDGVIGIGVVIYAVYSIMTDTGWFAGFIGVALLVVALPSIVILLILDFFVWKSKKSNK